MKTFAEKIISFNQHLHIQGKIPSTFRLLNPFSENPETIVVMQQFYRKYYNDNHQRKFIVAINPGRLGAGTTGIPFTDTKRLEEKCHIQMESAQTSEVSSIFVYNMIEKFGGVEKFYNSFYINSIFPLAIVQQSQKGNWVNANYYDDKALFRSLKPSIINNLKENIEFGLYTDEVFVLGKRNAKFLQEINQKEQLFGKLTILEHPRYIQQYKTKEIDFFIQKYLNAFGS